MTHRMLAFYDDDGIGPDTTVLYSLRHAAAYLPSLTARDITADDLWTEIEAGRLHAHKMVQGYTISIDVLEAYVAAGGFPHRPPARCAVLCNRKLFRLFALEAIGCVPWPDAPYPMLPIPD